MIPMCRFAPGSSPGASSRLRRILPSAVLLALAAAGARADTVLLKDGMKVTGRVIDLGGNSIELKIREGASRRIFLKEIEKATFDLAAGPAWKGLDKLVRKDGTEISGEVRRSEDGRSYVVSKPDGSKVEVPAADVLRSISRDQVGIEGSGVYSEKVRDAVTSSIAQVLAGGAEAATAEGRLKTLGIFAIADVREALRKAKPGSAADALERVVRFYRLKEVTPDSLQEISDYYRILAPLAPSDTGDQRAKAVDQKCQLLAQMFTHYLDESAPVAKVLILDPKEDSRVRAGAVALLGQNGFNRDLIDVYNISTGGQVQLAAGLALARNRLLVGAESLIEALEMDSPEIREIAFKALKEASGKDFGFGVHDTPSARKESIVKWKRWWGENRATVGTQANDLLSGAGRPQDTQERKKAEKLWQEGCLAADRKSFEAAETKMRAAVEADPTFSNAQVSLAILLFLHRDKGEEGRRMLEGLLERKLPDIGPRESTWIRYYLGRALEISGDPGRADLEYQEALNLDPKFFRAAIARGGLRFHQATSTALPPKAAAGQAKTSGDPTPAARHAMIDEALSLYQRAIALIDEYSGTLEILSASDLAPETPPAFERQEYNRGVIELKSFLRLQKSEAHFSMAKIRALIDDRPRAARELTSAIETLGTDRKSGAKELLVILHNYRGYILEEAGESAEALKEYKAVVRPDLEPGNPTALEGIRRLESRRPAASRGTGRADTAPAPAKARPKRRAAAPEDR